MLHHHLWCQIFAIAFGLQNSCHTDELNYQYSILSYQLVDGLSKHLVALFCMFASGTGNYAIII